MMNKSIFKSKIRLVFLTILSLLRPNNYSIQYKYLDYKINYISRDKKESFGLIVQGPLNSEYPNTLNTLRYYSKLIPNAKVVYSSHDIDNSVHKALRNINKIDVISLNTKPDSRFKYQIQNTFAALEHLKNKDVYYVAKTRSDQIILDINFAEVCKRRLFISDKLTEESKKRILFSSLNSFIDRKNSFSDMFIFSNINNQIEYWDAENEITPVTNDSRDNWINWVGPEMLQYEKYCLKNGGGIAKENERRLVGIIDYHEIGQVWQKYSTREMFHNFNNTNNLYYTFDHWCKNHALT